MPMHDDKNILIEGCTVVWDGITRPERMEDGGTKYSLKVVAPPNSPDAPLFQQLAIRTLNESEFKGHLPAGGLMPGMPAGPQDLQGMFPGWLVINATTYREPRVHAESGDILNPMQYGPLLYDGQRVDIVVSCKSYNQKAKGIKAQLQGFRIITSQNAQRLGLGGGGCDTTQVFGGSGQPGPDGRATGMDPTLGAGYQGQNQNAGANPYGNNQGQNQNAGANPYGNNQGQNQGAGANPYANQGPAQGQNQGAGVGPYANQGPAQGAGGDMYPRQNQNFLPGQGGHQ